MLLLKLQARCSRCAWLARCAAQRGTRGLASAHIAGQTNVRVALVIGHHLWEGSRRTSLHVQHHWTAGRSSGPEKPKTCCDCFFHFEKWTHRIINNSLHSLLTVAYHIWFYYNYIYAFKRSQDHLQFPIPSRLTNDLVCGVHSLVGEVPQHIVEEPKARGAFTFIRNPLLPDGSVCFDPSAGHILPAISRVLLIQQDSIHLTQGQLEIISKLLNRGSEDSKVLAYDRVDVRGRGHRCQDVCGKLTIVVGWELNWQGREVQESRVWGPPIYHHLAWERQRDIVTPCCCNSDCPRHVPRHVFLHLLFCSPTSTSGEEPEASRWIRSATWSQPPKTIIASSWI